jgi:hypothetical protein
VKNPPEAELTDSGTMSFQHIVAGLAVSQRMILAEPTRPAEYVARTADERKNGELRPRAEMHLQISRVGILLNLNPAHSIKAKWLGMPA